VFIEEIKTWPMKRKKRSGIGMMGALTPPSKSLSYIRGSDRRETITL
jgi:hypothetical protein